MPELIHLDPVPEVEDPPDILVTGAHKDVPRIKRLRITYMKENPQVRQVVGPTASERDMERWKLDEDDVRYPHEDGGFDSL